MSLETDEVPRCFPFRPNAVRTAAAQISCLAEILKNVFRARIQYFECRTFASLPSVPDHKFFHMNLNLSPSSKMSMNLRTLQGQTYLHSLKFYRIIYMDRR